jgi:hypothetical protein
LTSPGFMRRRLGETTSQPTTVKIGFSGSRGLHVPGTGGLQPSDECSRHELNSTCHCSITTCASFSMGEKKASRCRPRPDQEIDFEESPRTSQQHPALHQERNAERPSKPYAVKHFTQDQARRSCTGGKIPLSWPRHTGGVPAGTTVEFRILLNCALCCASVTP